MLIEHLEWDSEFFGIKIGRTVINNADEFDPIDFKKQVRENNYELVYVFKFAEMLPPEKVIKLDLELIDVLLTMSKKFDKNLYKNISYNFYTGLSEKELNESYNIAEQVAVVSRFYKEKKIGADKTKQLYRKWIDNALNKSFSDGLFIEKNSEEVAGIHLIKTDEKNKTGHCTLIGVNQNFKGLGIGTKLWKQSFGYWANEKEIEKCSVPVSLQNTESLNFHLKLGFNKIDEVKYIYHYRNNSF